ncbi:MAG: SapC family protein [Campylobacterota bacterium]|nr:SapC family protein [Campylobacterota bacterium]
MYKNIKLLNSKEDVNLKVSAIKAFKYAEKIKQVIITVDEFFKAAKSQPILFTKNESGEYFASTLLGLEQKNDFVNSKGEWEKSEYIPAYIRRYPFIFIQEKETLALAYDSDCKEINEEKGQSFFNEDGTSSEYVTNVIKFMESFQKSSIVTSAFVKELDELGILEDTDANIQVKGKKLAFTGFKRVNEEKLNSLNDEQIMKLIKNGSYKLIVAHLMSMSNFEKLISLQK